MGRWKLGDRAADRRKRPSADFLRMFQEKNRLAFSKKPSDIGVF
jgi:hypothetical protein